MVETRTNCFRLFGERLKDLRASIHYKDHRGKIVHMTQEEFGIQVGKFYGESEISRHDVNNWESGKRHLTQNDINLLIAIIQVLHKHGIISTLSEANDFLSINNLAGLNSELAIKIDPSWKKEFFEGKSTIETAHDSAITVVKNETEFIDLGLAPSKPDLFLGRDQDMIEIKSRLFSTEPNNPKMHVLTAMSGWPGVGKTTLASALVNDIEIMNTFHDGILWVSLGQRPKVLPKLLEWGKTLGDSQILRSGDIEQASRNLVRILRNKQCLLVIDDIWNISDIKPFLIKGNQCATIFTTRKRETASAIVSRSEQLFQVKVLEKQFAFELLKKVAGKVVERYEKECTDLLAELDGLPLAIQVAGRLLESEYDSGLDIVKLINDMKNDAILLDSLAPVDQSDLQKETTPTVAAVLMKSLDCLDETTKKYYAKLGGFAESPAVITLDALQGVWQTDHPEPIIRKLVGHGLLEYLESSAEYKIHGVLKMLCKSLWTDEKSIPNKMI